ncbi:hypothetical protein BDV38DRAFT_292748 [Aspergillus pseudotamarii]|uniref:Adenosine deaminase domain-containing protein n=1 Tax=Aspergillus pseudotamarii TaxID=132259 RepID=A0A5N6SWR6_ASPPS|nr:uncharacterized protein BDV38DRAFT_292748 [Aspergillus pseudotamarii]KAE8137853.1 hypothetical protein BDV38DRAFT_292748 [Aspergillus pseudotamarii]
MLKVEMHFHIEGTITLELRWSLSVSHGTPLPDSRTGKPCHNLSALEGLHDLRHDLEEGMLREERTDFSSFTMKRVQSQWIMCFLRGISPESAMSRYIAALPYRDMIAGVGLDFLERDRPPLFFEDVFQRARDDDLKVTCYCDLIDQRGGTGAGRIDHGLHVVDDLFLLVNVKQKGLGLTICPCGYSCYTGERLILERIALQRYAVDICWASTSIATQILEKLQEYLKQVL